MPDVLTLLAVNEPNMDPSTWRQTRLGVRVSMAMHHFLIQRPDRRPTMETAPTIEIGGIEFQLSCVYIGGMPH